MTDEQYLAEIEKAARELCVRQGYDPDAEVLIAPGQPGAGKLAPLWQSRLTSVYIEAPPRFGQAVENDAAKQQTETPQ